ncbi:MAG TPA: YqhA family protein [Pyrinomonadaceae bacterium]|jgi:uncharacterized membrane protein YqhA
MKWLIEKSRYLSYVSVLAMILGAMASIYLGVVKTLQLLHTAFTHSKETEPTLYILFEALDCFLIATALLVLAVAMYDLFIGELVVPEWMLVKDLTELKAKFTFVIIPVMAVKFVQKILNAENAVEVLHYGLAISLVAIALTVFNFVSIKAKEVEENLTDETETRAKDL